MNFIFVCLYILELAICNLIIALSQPHRPHKSPYSVSYVMVIHHPILCSLLIPRTREIQCHSLKAVKSVGCKKAVWANNTGVPERLGGAGHPTTAWHECEARRPSFPHPSSSHHTSQHCPNTKAKQGWLGFRTYITFSQETCCWETWLRLDI